jgi:hypothetical protein
MKLRWIVCVLLAVVTGCNGQEKEKGAIRGQIDLDTVLSCLPVDNETLQVANGPYWMSTFESASLTIGTMKSRPKNSKNISRV